MSKPFYESNETLRIAAEIVHDLASEYEYRGDQDYVPTEGERAMLEDFGCFLIGEVEQRLLAARTRRSEPEGE